MTATDISYESIYSELLNSISKITGTERSQIKKESRLVTDLGIDSLDIAEIQIILEDFLERELPQELFYPPKLTYPFSHADSEPLYDPTTQEIAEKIHTYTNFTQPLNQPSI